MILALLGCESRPTDPPPWECDARTMAAGEVRVRAVPCLDELLEDGDAVRGDFVLENAISRFFVRVSPTSLTQLARAGGTVIDAAPVGGPDTVLELLPELDGGWFTAIDRFVSESDSLTVEGRFADGASGQVTYRLGPDSPTLEIGAPRALVVPLAGAVSIGATLEREDGADAVLAGSSLVEDLGGWLRLAGPIAVGTRDEVTASRFDAIEVAGESDGTWVVAELDGEPVLRLPVAKGCLRRARAVRERAPCGDGWPRGQRGGGGRRSLRRRRGCAHPDGCEFRRHADSRHSYGSRTGACSPRCPAAPIS